MGNCNSRGAPEPGRTSAVSLRDRPADDKPLAEVKTSKDATAKAANGVDLDVKSAKSDGLDELLTEIINAGEAPNGPAAPEPVTSMDTELILAVRGPDFNYDGRIILAKVVDVYDGDTLRIKFRDGKELRQYSARMLGYDSPEMKPLKSNPNREAEIAAAHAAKDAIHQLTYGKLVVIELGKFDKYGRPLVRMYQTSRVEERGTALCINDWMIANGHGVPYDGGTKKAFDPDDHHADSLAHPTISVKGQDGK